MKFVAVERLQFSEIVLPPFGVVIDAQGTRPMSGIRLAMHQREYGRGSPFLLLRALDAPEASPRSKTSGLASSRYPAVAITQGPTRYIVLFDRTSKLPVAVRTHDDDHIYGDSNYDVMLGDWKAVNGAQIAHALSFRLGGRETQRLTYKEVTANATIATETFAVPEKLRTAALASATSDCPING